MFTLTFSLPGCRGFGVVAGMYERPSADSANWSAAATSDHILAATRIRRRKTCESRTICEWSCVRAILCISETEDKAAWTSCVWWVYAGDGTVVVDAGVGEGKDDNGLGIGWGEVKSVIAARCAE